MSLIKFILKSFCFEFLTLFPVKFLRVMHIFCSHGKNSNEFIVKREIFYPPIYQSLLCRRDGFVILWLSNLAIMQMKIVTRPRSIFFISFGKCVQSIATQHSSPPLCVHIILIGTTQGRERVRAHIISKGNLHLEIQNSESIPRTRITFPFRPPFCLLRRGKMHMCAYNACTLSYTQTNYPDKKSTLKSGRDILFLCDEGCDASLFAWRTAVWRWQGVYNHPLGCPQIKYNIKHTRRLSLNSSSLKHLKKLRNMKEIFRAKLKIRYKSKMFVENLFCYKFRQDICHKWPLLNHFRSSLFSCYLYAVRQTNNLQTEKFI